VFPILLVSLGLGSVVASTIASAPFLSAMSRHKGWVFLAAAAVLATNYWIAIRRPARLACAPGEICYVDSGAMRTTRRLFWTSVVIYAGALVLGYGAQFWFEFYG
jgi:hypothetical protein